MELLKGLLQITGLADPGRRQLEVRRDQAQNRLDWLNSPANNFPEDKFTVLPDLREYLEQHHTWETVSVHSNSVNDPLELPPNISESEFRGRHSLSTFRSDFAEGGGSFGEKWAGRSN